MTAVVPIITSFDQLPLWLSVEHMVQLYGRTPRAIERLVRLRRSADIPMPALTHPMRWSRSDVERHWSSGLSAARSRRAA